MSLLAPLFLAGIALVLGPILFHLIRQSPRKRITFSSTELLDASAPKAKQQSRIQNPWLLLIRCLIIILLCFAFARPFFPAEDNPSASGQPQRDLVVAIDQSASMAREDLWERSIEHARSIAAELGTSDRLSLILFSDTAETLVDAQQWSDWPAEQRASLLTRQLQSRSPESRSGKLDLALESAVQELESAREIQDAHGFGEIVIISDFARGSQLSGLTGIEWPADSSLRRIAVQSNASSTNNVGIRWLGWSETDGASVNAHIGLTHSNPETGTEIELSIEHAETGEGLMDAQTLYLESQAEHLARFELPSVATEIPLKVSIGGDGSSFDNTLFIAPDYADRISLALMTDQDLSDPTEAPYFIAKALRGFESPLVELSVNPDGSLSRQEALILEAPLSREQAAAVRSRIEGGASALFLLSSEEQIDSLRAVTRMDDWGIETANDANALIGFVDFEHPLFQPFADARFNNFANINFWNAPHLAHPENGAIRQIAAYDTGSPLLLELPLGEGRLYIWAGSWSPSQSQWALSSKFLPWLHRFALEASGGAPLPANAVFTPAKVEQYERLSFADAPASAGLYKISSDTADRWIAFHLPPEESDVAPLSDEDWDRMGLPESNAQSQALRQERFAAEAQAENAVQTERRQKVWQWILFAVLALLAAESLLAIKITSRRREALT